ncbi:GNAT family N-acetyltransferase [Oceanotoga sp. DSM 15011]|uniref:Ribosomal-protein-alanine N-acetyltransferase n=1 Tax=Oceanotoga teriensis TaxID=515440 RepID=A0AA45C5U2_9BACT|nr:MULTISPECIES: N-acetyltransferase [Oceanotoga]MDN5343267.1 [ribosomal protein S18]-alanine N-acetyltransferase [Oceanotoga sp.]MDO7977399.1 GNAT family N-acetyltransferase [Oceanotoga teriensis]PWJ89650.1 ribosomal-protein-alanine N-acetyltransferase [Oceanotoga teriensis]UYO98920.1 GNAT family N-acetyltransferase [Oceanotoga sp. DSM 15011]
MLIEKAELKDLESIMKIEYESFDTDIAENEKIFKKRIKNFSDGFYIIKIKNEVIGYICSELWEYEENLNIEKFELNHSMDKFHKMNGTELYISSFGLLKNYRKKGFGKVLFDVLMNRITQKYDIKSVVLIVSEKWEAAKKIYIDHGFENIKVLNDFFNDEEDGIIMRKKLNIV